MPKDRGEPRRDDAFWYEFLSRGDSNERRVRSALKLLPASPRCTLCAAPFAGVGGTLMRAIGKRPSDKNPAMCNSCFQFIIEHHGGAEIDVTMLFADIRGSTAMAETMTPAAFRERLDRFYVAATAVVQANDGGVDKFVGDELVAMFFPLLSGPDHTARAVETAVRLLRATGHDDPDGPWLPVGAGVHTGKAWVGAVGDAAHTELTAVGDTVNVAARLAAAAAAGEVIVSADAAKAANLDAGLDRRMLDLKGKGAPFEVVSVRIGATVGV
ncbi:MAG TPA: adenylate/guanylate cyclase domain-containing protein [Candidatus Limnocylindrales bacterium]|nr:adenylate/guanylate cyclase domain-containing protein [Candidatus Limnocylindrales bacterium]